MGAVWQPSGEILAAWSDVSDGPMPKSPLRQGRGPSWCARSRSLEKALSIFPHLSFFVFVHLLSIFVWMIVCFCQTLFWVCFLIVISHNKSVKISPEKVYHLFILFFFFQNKTKLKLTTRAMKGPRRPGHFGILRLLDTGTLELVYFLTMAQKNYSILDMFLSDLSFYL